jgi:hypothetical protein
VTVLSLADTQSFFIGDVSILPQDFFLLKDPKNVKIFSILFIIFTFSAIFFLDNFLRGNERSELASVSREFVVPHIENELSNFLNRSLRKTYRFSEEVRASVWLPCREGIFKWRLCMVAKTKNIDSRELRAKFRFDEGVLGRTFTNSIILGIEQCNVSVLNVSGDISLPSEYVDLDLYNKNLINPEIKLVTVAVSYDKGSTIGLLAIDTTRMEDIPLIENERKMHADIEDWLFNKVKVLDLLWRMNNHV